MQTFLKRTAFLLVLLASVVNFSKAQTTATTKFFTKNITGNVTYCPSPSTCQTGKSGGYVIGKISATGDSIVLDSFLTPVPLVPANFGSYAAGISDTITVGDKFFYQTIYTSLNITYGIYRVIDVNGKKNNFVSWSDGSSVSFSKPYLINNVYYYQIRNQGILLTYKFDGTNWVSVSGLPTGCDAITVTSANGAINIAGLNNTNVIQVFNSNWSASVFNQTLNNSTATVPNLIAGQVYHVKIQQYNTSSGAWVFVCEKNVDITVNGIPVPSGCRYQDSLSLVSLYNSTGGANWTTKWNLSQPISTWFGVSLNANGCVSRISIGQNNLTGSLPSNFNFSELVNLALPYNNLSGVVPNFNSPKLDTLYLTFNQFTGSLPNFSNTHLVNLDISHNQLSGSLPNFNLPNLIALYLDDNKLTGNIPNFNLPKLNALILYNNQLNGSIPSLVLPSLNLLALNNNNLSGCIPTSLKAFCGKQVSIANNSNLSTQDFAAFCSSNTGACVSASQDLAVSIAADKTTLIKYTTTKFIITVKNNSGAAFTNVSIKFPKPVGTSAGGTATTTTGVWNEYCAGGVYCTTWSIPTLAANTSATLTVPLFILDVPSVTATASLTGSTPTDIITSNNSATVTLAQPSAISSQLSSLSNPVSGDGNHGIFVQKISPNPTDGELQLDVETRFIASTLAVKSQSVDFLFYNSLGILMRSEKRNLELGINNVNFDVSDFSDGIYFIQIRNEKFEIRNPVRFVKQ